MAVLSRLSGTPFVPLIEPCRTSPVSLILTICYDARDAALNGTDIDVYYKWFGINEIRFKGVM
jgi:hypothetical protein